MSKHVVVVTYDNLCTFEFGIAVEVFGLPRPEFDFDWYRFDIVAAESRQVRAVGGIKIEANSGLAAMRGADIIVIPGWRNRAEQPPQALLDALTNCHAKGAQLLSICSGVFVLAAAGLLDGQPATTHWQHLQALRTQYPDINVVEDVLYVDAGRITTSAGSAAGIDAALHLVRRDYGAQVANQVARRMVMAPHRDGGQAQYVAAPIAPAQGQPMGQVLEWALQNLHTPITLSEMASHAMMSERSFQRRFQREMGVAPKAWLQRQRIFRAQEILETTRLSLDAIAHQCGYSSLNTFRVAFKRMVGTAPAAYRSRFAN